MGPRDRHGQEIFVGDRLRHASPEGILSSGREGVVVSFDGGGAPMVRLDGGHEHRATKHAEWWELANPPDPAPMPGPEELEACRQELARAEHALGGLDPGCDWSPPCGRCAHE
jgi:hypothetical protein